MLVSDWSGDHDCAGDTHTINITKLRTGCGYELRCAQLDDDQRKLTLCISKHQHQENVLFKDIRESIEQSQVSLVKYFLLDITRQGHKDQN